MFKSEEGWTVDSRKRVYLAELQKKMQQLLDRRDAVSRERHSCPQTVTSERLASWPIHTTVRRVYTLADNSVDVHLEYLYAFS